MSRSPLDSNLLGKNTTNITMSIIESITVGTRTQDPISLIQPTEFPEQNGKAHIPGEPDPDLSSQDSS